MAKQSCLNFDGADAMSGNLDDLVGAPGEPNITVFVDLRRIAGVIDTGNNLPIIAAVPFRFTPQLWGQSREGPLDHHDALFIYPARCAVERHHLSINAWHGDRRGARLDGQHSQSIRIAKHRAAGFGLPHMIDYGNFVLENLLLQPFPRRRVQNLARAEHPLEILVIDVPEWSIAIAHQQSHRGWRGENAAHAILLHQGFPRAFRSRMVERTFEGDRGRTRNQRRVHNVAVTDNPSDVGGGPPDI